MITDKQRAAAERRMRRYYSGVFERLREVEKIAPHSVLAERMRWLRERDADTDRLDRFILTARFGLRDRRTGAPFAVKTRGGWLVNEDALFKWCWNIYVTVESVIAKATSQFGAQGQAGAWRILGEIPAQGEGGGIASEPVGDPCKLGDWR
jgi:hypothetical protein